MSTLSITAGGASPDKSDNTALIQTVIDTAQAGDTVWVPPGSFAVSALPGLRARSSVNMQIDGQLVAVPNQERNFSVLALLGVEHVAVVGHGSIMGERAAADATIPESTHGHGLSVVNSSDITISGIHVANCKGDGFYIENATDLLLTQTTITNSKRNALSIINGQRMRIVNNTFQFTNGPAPMPCAGIDIEPDPPPALQTLLDITITGNRFVRNKGAGVYCAFDGTAVQRRIFIVDNYFEQHYPDGFGPPIRGKPVKPLANLLYATMRWCPGYDYWAYPREYTIS